MLQKIDVNIIDDDISGKAIETLFKLEEIGFVNVSVPKVKKLSELKYTLSKQRKGFSFNSDNDITEVFYNNNKLVKINFKFGSCIINPAYITYKQDLRHILINLIKTLPNEISLLLGKYSMNKEEIIDILKNEPKI